MADPITLLILLVALVAIIIVVYWLKIRNYMMVNVTSAIVRKESGSSEAGPIGNEQMTGQMGYLYYFPVEVYYFGLANGDTVNVSKVNYDRYKIGEKYSYEKRVKKPKHSDIFK